VVKKKANLGGGGRDSKEQLPSQHATPEKDVMKQFLRGDGGEKRDSAEKTRKSRPH